jgi:hypothetical protein
MKAAELVVKRLENESAEYICDAPSPGSGVTQPLTRPV